MLELFDLDLTPFGDTIRRFHPYDFGTITYLGNGYTHMPIQCEGFETTSRGLPTPRITVSNVMGAIGQLIKGYDGIQGARITRTKLRQQTPPYNYLSTDVIGLPDIWIIDRPTNHTRLTVTFELQSIFDLSNQKIPRRSFIESTCPFVYKSSQCGYTGSLPTCSKTLTDCKTHFQNQTGQTNPTLNFGGFPNVDRVPN